MTCQECELLLAAGENPGEHLAICAACRTLDAELRANALAFEAFSDDPLPSVRQKVLSRIPSRRRWIWASAFAAAAAAAAVLIVMLMPRRESAPPPAQIAATNRDWQEVGTLPKPQPAPPVRKRRPKPPQPPQSLMVKMLTPDPDVVIYWQFEAEEQQK